MGDPPVYWPTASGWEFLLHSALYDMLLLDLSVNLTRFVTLDDMVHQDAFMVSAALLQEYFPHYRTENIRLHPLEQAFLHYDYGAYRLYGKCYLGV